MINNIKEYVSNNNFLLSNAVLLACQVLLLTILNFIIFKKSKIIIYTSYLAAVNYNIYLLAK